MRRAAITISVLAAAWGLFCMLDLVGLIPGGIGGPILWLLIPYTLAVVAGGTWERLPEICKSAGEIFISALVWVLSIRLKKARSEFESVEFEYDEGCGPATLLPHKAAGRVLAQAQVQRETAPAAEEPQDEMAASAQTAEAGEPAESRRKTDKMRGQDALATLPADRYLEISPTPAKRLVIDGWRGQVPSEMFIAPASPQQAAELIRSLNAGLPAGSPLCRSGIFSQDNLPRAPLPRFRSRPDPSDLADRIVHLASRECPDPNCLAEALKIAAGRCLSATTV
ncbi:MAG: hypothetical protein HZA50_03190 [Planctomycetes bacterium]|nr:hypothetical protein [Planctomycetota bacterium]